MAVLKNRAKMSTSTTGTGTITLGSAESGYQTFGDAGVANADVVRYVIEDGAAWEIGTGTYTATGTTLTRTVSESSNADAAIVLTGSATVFIGATAEDIPALYAANESSPAAQPSATGANAVAIGDSAVAAGSYSASLGYKANANGNRSIALGYAYTNGADAATISTGTNSPSYGALASRAVAIGWRSKAAFSDSFAIGDTATTSATNQIALGGTADTVKISGTYTLPTADGTANQVLTTDGAGAVTFATAGGGADLYAANPSSATDPTANGLNSIAIGDGVVTGSSAVGGIAIGQDTSVSGTNSVSLGKSGAYGTGSFAAAISSISYQNYGADGDYSISVGYRSRASSSGAIAIGYEAKSLNNYSAAISRSYASGTDSFAAAIANNTSSYGATGSYGVAIGRQAKATGSGSVSLGGYNNQATGSNSLNVGGSSNVALSNYSATIGGYNTNADTQGKVVFGSGYASWTAGPQSGITTMFAATTDATATEVLAQNQRVTLPNNSVYGFTGTIIARENSAQTNDFAVWEVKGGAVRAASASTTALGSYNINKISESTGAAAWAIAISADTTNGAIAFTVTGEASHSIRWVATINTTEVTY